MHAAQGKEKARSHSFYCRWDILPALQRPPLNNMPRRQGVDIGDRCPIERVQPNHVPPVPSNPRRGRPCACPRTTSNQRTPAWRLPCVSPIVGKQFQPALTFFPRQTVPTPKLGCTRRRVQSTNVSARMHAAKAEDKVRSRSCLCSVAILLACLNVTIHSTALGMFTFRFLSHPQNPRQMHQNQWYNSLVPIYEWA